MDDTLVANRDPSEVVLSKLSTAFDALTPEAQKAARYVLENPREVSVSTVREVAGAAQVSPNTLVRMARQLGFEGYDDFREPFRDAVRRGSAGFAGRAKRLQDARAAGGLDGLFAEMAASARANLEQTFAGLDAAELRAAAEAIWKARDVYVLGVGVNNANARNFTRLASMAMTRFHAIPSAGATPTDDVAWADERDALIAMTTRPYRVEVVKTVALARAQGVTVVALSDSRASPIIRAADHPFVVATETPQFFPSSVAIIAVLEALLSFVVASASPDIVERVDALHARRRELGLYDEEGA